MDNKKVKSIRDIKVGDTFGRQTVVELPERSKCRDHRYPDAICQCDCGQIKQIRLSNLLSGNSLSCGCLALELAHQKSQNNIIGKRFGRLVVQEEAPNSRPGHLRLLCLCDCGNYTNVSAGDLRTGMTRSCGCLRRDLSKSRSEDITGKTFNELTAIERVDDLVTPGGYHFARWKYRCSCGKEIVALMMNVKRGLTKSCGHIGKSYAEHQIIQQLDSLHVPYQHEYSEMRGLVNPNTGNEQFLDFVITCPDNTTIVIEHQGKQHFYTGKMAELEFGKLQRELTDDIKRKYCAEHNIPLYETRYDEDYLEHVKQILRSHGFIIPQETSGNG